MSSAKRFVVVADAIRPLLAAGSPGDRLPSEADLAQQFSVSRATVREALSLLWVEGLIIRRWGSGTFIGEHQHDGGKFRNIYQDVAGVRSLPQHILRSGHTPEILSFSVSSIEPDERTSVLTGVQQDVPLVCVERCLAIDGVPAILMRDIMPESIGGVTLDFNALEDFRVDLRTLIREAGPRIVKDEAELEAVKAPASVAALFNMPLGDPILCAQQTSSADSGQVLVSSEIYYRSQAFSTVLVRTISE